MRAVARGMFQQSLPACPERCGGQRACLDDLSPEQLRHREAHGCDRPIKDGGRAWYAIRCPRCDGAKCELCREGPYPGFKIMRRCPNSYLTPDVAELVNAIKWLSEGFLPDGANLGDQSISFVDARNIFERERNEVLAEQAKEG